MEVLSQIFYFIIIIGVLVFVHELGHFAAAKLFKMRVERFSIGFPPRAFGKTFGDTDYCISWLPIGGYVKIAGMIDESLDTDHLNREPEPWEFRAKPVWQRMIVIVAGVVMNIVLAVGIFWGLNIVKGKEFHEITTIGYVSPSTIAGQSGLMQGDDIISVNGETVTTWEDILRKIYVSQISEDLRINVNRDGSEKIIHIAQNKIPNLNEEPFGILPAGSRARVGNVQSGMPASKIGLKQGDVFVSIEDETIRASEDVTRIINKHPDSPVKIIWERGGEEMASLVTPNSDGMIGIMVESFYPGPVRVERYGFFEAFTVGVSDLNSTVALFSKSIWNIIIGKSSFSKNIGGPVKIAEMAAQSAELGLSRFLTLMAILSISLAIINIIPFPGLDGGHFGFLLYEAIFRREVPRRIYLAMQQAGMVLLIAFMIFVIYNDFVN